MRKIIEILLIMLLIASMASCIAVGSGGEKINNLPTLGQQLIDLQKAKDEGAITLQEYEELKIKLKKASLASVEHE